MYRLEDSNMIDDITNIAVPSQVPAKTQEDSQSLPSYFNAADNHNLGNGNFSFTDPSTWEEGINNVGKFAVTAAISGVDSLAQSGIAAANWFGADIEQRDTAADISALDSDLGQYYTENKQAVDLAGFIVTSFAPGLAGIKVLNAGQTALRGVSEAGYLGSNLSRGLGLLIPETEINSVRAASEIAKGSASFNILNASVLKTLGSGVVQNVLEGAAFETAVNATMFKAPTISEDDGWDIAKNIALAGVTQGVIGGAITGAQSYFKIKNIVKAVDLEAKPFSHITDLGSSSSISDRIITHYSDMRNTPPVPADSEFADVFQRLAETKQRKLTNLISQGLFEMTDGDSELTRDLMSQFAALDENQISANLLHSTELGRFTTPFKAENQEDKVIGYVKLLGEDSGKLSFETPKVTNLADTLGSSEAVLKEVKDYKFKLDVPYSHYEFNWDTPHSEAEARYIWADGLVKNGLVKDGIHIGERDIPLLEAALDSNVQRVNVVTGDGSGYTITNSDDLFKHVQESKNELISAGLKAAAAGADIGTEEISKIANVKRSLIEGQQAQDVVSDYFARQDNQLKYTSELVQKGLWDSSKGLVDISTKPTYLKVAYDTASINQANGMLQEGMAYIRSKYNLYQQAYNNVFSKYVGDLASSFYHPSDSTFLTANRYGAGAGLASSANGNYHTLESWAEYIGNLTSKVKKSFKDSVSERLQAPAYALANNQEAAIEFDAINQKIAATPDKYVLSDDGTYLVPRSLKQYQDAISAGNKNVVPPTLAEGTQPRINIVNQETRDAIAAHIEVNGNRVQALKEIHAVQGSEDVKDPNTFYPIRPNPNDFKHFAFVVDDTVSGSGHISMIHAQNAEDLQTMIDSVNKLPQKYSVITKAKQLSSIKLKEIISMIEG